MKQTLFYFFSCAGIFAFIESEAQTRADSSLLAEIRKIKAIDNHAHPIKYVAEGEKPDDEYDALPLDAVEAFALPTRINPGNTEFIQAWRTMYGYKYNDMGDAHIAELLESKKRLLKEKSDGSPAWLLDQLNIETMLANRVAMGRGLNIPCFRWVSFVDALIFPLSNETAKKSNPDYKGFYPGEERLLKRYLTDLKISTLPANLDEYLKKCVTATLEKQKRDGAVAVKYEAAYLRKLNFEFADEARAKSVYAKYIRGGEPSAADYKILQDFLFHYIALEAGRLGLAVHIHCLNGYGSYYRQSGSDPLLLESVLNDPTLRKTNFVILHGAYPNSKQLNGLLTRPNVYIDFSGVAFLTYPRELSEILRNWMETYPDKILFGTDAFSFGPGVDWGETAWLSNASTREALAIALTGMMDDKEITRDRAIELARMVLHDNAAKLYKLGSR